MTGRAYISIVRWPKAFTLQNKVEALVMAMGMDPFTAGMRAVQETPFVVSRVDGAVAPDIVSKFTERRVSAFAMTQGMRERLPPVRLVKRMAAALGADEPMYMVEFWKGDPVGLKSSDIFLLVRGTVDRSLTKTTVTSQTRGGGAWMLGSAGAVAAGMEGAQVSRNTEVKVSQILDVYLTDRTMVRINSDRVSFDVLGKERGFSAMENVDKLALRLGTEAPQALVDTGFGKFKPPTDVATEISGGRGDTSTVQRDEGSSFDFYSGWIYTIQRALAGR